MQLLKDNVPALRARATLLWVCCVAVSSARRKGTSLWGFSSMTHLHHFRHGRCCRLETSLQAFELKPTHEDVFDVHANSVEEYLQRLHEMTVTTAIQVRACAYFLHALGL